MMREEREATWELQSLSGGFLLNSLLAGWRLNEIGVLFTTLANIYVNEMIAEDYIDL